MSHIPNSAMPHAGGTSAEPAAQPSSTEEKSGTSLKERAGKLADTARANPKTAVAAGAAVLAGAVAAAAIPLIKSRAKSGGSKSSGAESKSKKSS